jgi:hypothetical protein
MLKPCGVAAVASEEAAAAAPAVIKFRLEKICGTIMEKNCLRCPVKNSGFNIDICD